MGHFDVSFMIEILALERELLHIDEVLDEYLSPDKIEMYVEKRLTLKKELDRRLLKLSSTNSSDTVGKDSISSDIYSKAKVYQLKGQQI